MLTLQQIKEDPERIIARLAVKGFDGKQGVNDVIDFDDERRSLQYQNDNLAAELKKQADAIGRLMKEGRREEAEEAKKNVAEIKAQQKEIADRLTITENAIRDILLGMPNIPCDAVPEGKSAEDNVVEKTGGPMPDLPADALPHWELAKKYNLINFDLGVKITGPGFPVYIGKGARLQRALIQFFLQFVQSPLHRVSFLSINGHIVPLHLQIADFTQGNPHHRPRQRQTQFFLF